MEDETTDQEMSRLQLQREIEERADSTAGRLTMLKEWLSLQQDILQQQEAAFERAQPRYPNFNPINPTIPKPGSNTTITYYLSDWIKAVDEALTHLAGVSN